MWHYIHSFQIVILQNYCSEKENVLRKKKKFTNNLFFFYNFMFFYTIIDQKIQHLQLSPTPKAATSQNDIFVVSSKWDHQTRIVIQMSLINYSVSASLSWAQTQMYSQIGWL